MNQEDKDGLINFSVVILIVTLLCVSFYRITEKDFVDIAEHEKNFSKNVPLFLEGKIVSKANGWKMIKKEDSVLFIKDDNYIEKHQTF